MKTIVSENITQFYKLTSSEYKTKASIHIWVVTEITFIFLDIQWSALINMLSQEGVVPSTKNYGISDWLYWTGDLTSK